MSYEEKNITISLVNSLLILGFYVVNMVQIYQQEVLDSVAIFTLWASVIILAIVTSIISSILTYIVLEIIRTIATQEEEQHFADERDKLIALKGTRNAYFIFSIGALLAMGSLIFNKNPMVMFSALTFCFFFADILGDISKIYLYRRGA